MTVLNRWLLSLLFVIQIVYTDSNQQISISNDILSIEDDIVTHPDDRLQYRALTLTNRMKVLLISDDIATEASVALDVNAGYTNSPKNIPYLADLVAHTFLIAAWPQVQQKSRTSRFLESSNGRVTSTTTADHTVFDLTEIYAPLTDILKRFSDQLLSPEISMDLLERGIWEYNHDAHIDHKSDVWRWKTFLRSQSAHYHNYYAPNLVTEEPNTLKNENINKSALLTDMIKFYDQHYSSNLISLVVASNKSISDLTNLVVPLFSRVPNKNLPQPVWLKHPYGPNQTGQIFRIEHDDHTYDHKLIMLFSIPDYISYYDYFISKPWSYIIFVLTRKGEHSLPVVLKEKGLAKKVKAKVLMIAEGFGFFEITCHLTQKGKQNVKQVVRLVMEYIKYVQSLGPQNWIYKELQIELQMKFKESIVGSTSTSELASTLHTVPASYWLTERYIMHKYQPHLITKILSQLTVENMNVYIWFKSIAGKPGKKRKFFDKNYTVEKMAESFLNKLIPVKSQSMEFTLPSPNLYQPPNVYQPSKLEENVKLDVPFANVSYPTVIHQSEFCRVWYLKDDIFMLPKAFVIFKLTNPLKHDSPLNFLASEMYQVVISRLLRTRFQREQIAMLDIFFTSNYNGYTVSFEGYSDKMQDIVISVFKTLVESTADTEERFNEYKAKFTKWLSMRAHENQMSKSNMYVKFLQSPLKWMNEEIYSSSKTFSYDRFKQFKQEFFSKLFIEMFSYGNITDQDTIKMYNDVWNIIENHFPVKPLFLEAIEKPKIALLPEGRQYVLHATASRRPHVSFVHSMYQFKPAESWREHAVYQVVSCMIREIHRKLHRTFEDSKKLTIELWLHDNFIEISTQNLFSTPEQIDSMIEDYLKLLENKLMGIDNKTEYQELENSCKKKIVYVNKTHFNSMDDVAIWYWYQIFHGDYTFSFNESQIFNDPMENMTSDDILSWYKEILGADSPKRRKFSIFIYPSGDSEVNGRIENATEQIKNVTYITDIKAFKSSLRSNVGVDGTFEPIIPASVDLYYETDDD